MFSDEEKRFLLDFADWLDGGTPRAWGFENPCGPGITWDPTIEEQKIMDAVDVIRDAIDYKENLR